MANGRIFNTNPSGKIRNDVPGVRTSNFQTGHAGEKPAYVTAGTPIGLLLALTYASNMFLGSAPYGPRPNARILNT